MNQQLTFNRKLIVGIIAIFVIGLAIGAIGTFMKLNENASSDILLTISMILNTIAVLAAIIFAVRYFWNRS